MQKSVWDSVGQTPLIYIRSLSRMTGCHIYGKAEFLNPGGSVKDRAAKGIIEKAEREGLLKPGGTIVEGTAGNTGIGIATLAAERGYKVVISMPNNQSQEKYDTLKALGVDLRLVEPVPFANQNHFYHTAKKIASEIPGAVWADQFENTANQDMHFRTTGPEIWQQTGGRVDHFTCAAGTGGTIGGLSTFLKQKNKNIKITLVDPEGSGLANYVKHGVFATTGSSVTEGIGIMRLTENFKKALVDEAVTSTDADMISMLYHIAKHDGLLLGTSAALNLYSAYKIGRQNQDKGLNIVTILCDHGSRYVSRVFNQEWLKQKGLIPKSLV